MPCRRHRGTLVVKLIWWVGWQYVFRDAIVRIAIGDLLQLFAKSSPVDAYLEFPLSSTSSRIVSRRTSCEFVPTTLQSLFQLDNERKTLYRFVRKLLTKRWFCDGDTNQTEQLTFQFQEQHSGDCPGVQLAVRSRRRS
jgi:hypothetical protein